MVSGDSLWKIAARLRALKGTQVLHGLTHSLGPDFLNWLLYGHDNRSEFARLSASENQERLKKGLAISRRIFAQQPMAQYLVEETIPGQQADNDAALDAMRADLAGVVHHPVGSCAMGTGPEAVVDPQLRVIGVGRLRVVDASVMPTLVAGRPCTL